MSESARIGMCKKNRRNLTQHDFSSSYVCQCFFSIVVSICAQMYVQKSNLISYFFPFCPSFYFALNICIHMDEERWSFVYIFFLYLKNNPAKEIYWVRFLYKIINFRSISCIFQNFLNNFNDILSNKRMYIMWENNHIKGQWKKE